MSDFFISYNHDDAAWAEWIATQLEAAGYRTIIQIWDFSPGSNFVLEMDRAMRLAERTLALLSPFYLASLYTHPEWAAAFARDPTGSKRTLIPVRVRRVELAGLLAQIVYIDLVGKDEETARQALLAGVKVSRERGGGAFPGRDSVGFPGSRVIPRVGGYRHSLSVDDPVNVAVNLAEEGHISDALEALNEAARREPGRALVHYNLGVLYDALGNTKEAIVQYRRAIALDDEFSDSHFNLGLIYLRSGEMGAARQQFDLTLVGNPLHQGASRGFGSIAVESGEYELAIRIFEQVLRLNPDDIVSRNNLADALLRLGRLEEAHAEIMKARLIDPTDEASRRTEEEILGALQ